MHQLSEIIIYILNLMSMSANSNLHHCYSRSISTFSETYETLN